MGNRANVVFASKDWTELSPAVYLHWNGGPESVYGFLEELDRRQVRSDQCYETARFTQIVAEVIGGNLSLGLANVPDGKTLIDRLLKTRTDDSDNGFYVVNRQEKKVRRFTSDYEKEEASNYKEHFLKEWEEKDVLEEKEDAEKHEYRKEFREHFKKIEAFKSEMEKDQG